MSRAAKMPWPMAAVANAAEVPPKPDEIGALGDELDHPGEATEQQQVDRQDHERAPPAHPAAQLLDADGADPAAATCRSAPRRPRPGGARRGASPDRGRPGARRLGGRGSSRAVGVGVGMSVIGLT